MIDTPLLTGLDKTKKKKVLLVGLRAFGDMVLTQPAISAVRDSCPDARIDYVMEEAYSSLFQDESDLNRVISLPRRNQSGNESSFEYYKRYGSFLREIRNASYDVAVDLFSRGPRSRSLVFASRARRRVGTADHRNPLLDHFFYTDQIVVPNQLTHLTDQILHVMSRLGFRTQRSLPQFIVTKENDFAACELLGRFGEEYSEDFLILFPGSGAPAKNWPAIRYVELATELLRKGFPLLVLGGNNDSEAVASVVRGIDASTGVDLSRFKGLIQNDLNALKGIISLSVGAIGNDSGPLHLTQAIGKKTLVLFGPGDHVSYRPFHGGMVRKGLACSPCQSFLSVCPDNQCMKSIDVNSVLGAWEKLEDHL